MKEFNWKQRFLLFVLVSGLVLILAGCQPTEVVDTSLNGMRRTLIEENLEEWFSGEELHSYVGSNRDYDWYIDQGNTGDHSNNNCGPTSAVMAMKWLDEDFEGTVEEAREEYLINGGWWNTSTISQYFGARDVEHTFMMLDPEDKGKAVEDLKTVIDEEKIAILCIDMEYISRENDSNLHVNRFYDYDDGHFLIVKGYADIDDKVYFEVYDPNNWSMTYEDGSPMGQDRYYLAEELIDSAINWYQFAIVIE